MVFRKPYAFFIKMFKPIHLVMAFIVVYLIYLDSNILRFLNSYINSSTSIVGENIRNDLINIFIYLIPAIIIILSMVILGVMVRKRKPALFYVVNIFAFIVILVINLYTDNFLGVLEKSIVSVRVVKLIHDLVLIDMIIETISFIFLVGRGMGINFKKFGFNSDISKLDISDSDKEEFELDINVDVYESKRKRKENYRNLKYKYLENKFKINLIICVFIILSVVIGIMFLMPKSYKTEGSVYYINGINIGVDETIILNTDYSGKRITDDYLLVVNTKISSNENNKQVYLEDFNLQIGELTFKATTKYSKYLVDIGNVFDESSLEKDYVNYLFVYEIPEKFITSDMVFIYSGGTDKLKIKLNPRDLNSNEISVSNKLGEEISFIDSIGDVKFKITDYEIKDKFIFEYDYCIKSDDCIRSKEYVKPSIDKNFDKVIMRLSIDYKDNTNNVKTFYKLFSRYGSIVYTIGDNVYSQNGSFEEIKSSKVSTKGNSYIGINSDIINAESIKLVFNIRNSKYEYILK